MANSYPMTEKEKMIAGYVYAPEDPECAAERTAAHDLCFAYNNTRPSDTEARRAILKKLLPNSGERISVGGQFQCQFGYNITVGEDFRAGEGVMLIDNTLITIGDNVTIGDGTIFVTPVHPMTPEKRNTYKIYCLPIKVGDNVTIGAQVNVLAGVTIGDNVKIADASTVTRDIPSNCVAGGSPARVLERV